MVVMLGRFTRDFEFFKVKPNMTPMARAGFASNTYIRNSQTGEERTETCFIDVEVWGPQVAHLATNFGKGDPCLLRGRIRLNQWVDRKTQQPRRAHVLYIESWENVKGLDGASDGSATPGGEPAGAHPVGTPAEDVQRLDTGVDSDRDSDLFGQAE